MECCFVDGISRAILHEKLRPLIGCEVMSSFCCKILSRSTSENR